MDFYLSVVEIFHESSLLFVLEDLLVELTMMLMTMTTTTTTTTTTTMIVERPY
jgi:hypothetical protein